MSVEELRKLILCNQKESALLIGNGINLCGGTNCSWNDLLIEISKKYGTQLIITNDKQGISNTEFFDTIEISILGKIKSFDPKEFELQRIKLDGILVDPERAKQIEKEINEFALRPPKNFNIEDYKPEKVKFGEILSTLKSAGIDIELMVKLSELGNKFMPAVKSILLDEICKKMRRWSPSNIHISTTKFAKKYNIPILTTNYDTLLEQASEAKLHDFKHPNSSDSLPIGRCYTSHPFPEINKFGIWHINGVIEYPSSILIGLSHYMRIMQQIRTLIMGNNKYDAELFENIKDDFLSLKNTWVQIVFSKNIFVFGLSLNTDEVVLRWLLMERAKLYALYPYLKRKGWYITKIDEEISPEKEYFFKSVGFEIIRVPDYQDMYKAISLQ